MDLNCEQQQDIEARKRKTLELSKKLLERKCKEQELLREKAWEMILQNNEFSLEKNNEKRKKKMQHYRHRKKKLEIKKDEKSAEQKPMLNQTQEKNSLKLNGDTKIIANIKTKVTQRSKDPPLKIESHYRDQKEQKNESTRETQFLSSRQQLDAVKCKREQISSASQRKREYRKKQWDSFTPEQKEAYRIRTLELKNERFSKRWNSFTPEQKEAFRIKRNKHQNEYRQKRKMEKLQRLKNLELVNKYRSEKEVEKYEAAGEKEFLPSKQQLEAVKGEGGKQQEEKLKARQSCQNDIKKQQKLKEFFASKQQLEKETLKIETTREYHELKAAGCFGQHSEVKKKQISKASQRKREYRKKRWNSFTPEQKEAYRIRTLKLKNERFTKRWNSFTPEQKEAFRIKRNKHRREYLQKRKMEKLQRLKNLELVNNYRSDKEVEKYEAAGEKEFLPSKQQLEAEKGEGGKQQEEKLKARQSCQNDIKKQQKLKEFFASKEQLEKETLKIETTREYNELKAAEFFDQHSEVKKKEISKSSQRKREYRKKRGNSFTPEQKEAYRIRTLELNNERFLKRWNSFTPEQKEAFRIKRNKHQNEYRQKRKMEKLQRLQNLELLKKYRAEEEIEKIFKEVIGHNEEQNLEQSVGSGVEKTIKDMTRTAELNHSIQDTSSLHVKDNIDNETKVLQQTLINAMPKQHNENPIPQVQQESLFDDKSWFGSSEESLSTEKTTKSQNDFRSFFALSNILESILNGSNRHYSNKIERRKTIIEESMRCMRATIDASVKGDGFEIFGKSIAQKLRTNKREEVQTKIAKLLIDNVLQNLSIGVYDSERKISNI